MKMTMMTMMRKSKSKSNKKTMMKTMTKKKLKKKTKTMTTRIRVHMKRCTEPRIRNQRRTPAIERRSNPLRILQTRSHLLSNSRCTNIKMDMPIKLILNSLRRRRLHRLVVPLTQNQKLKHIKNIIIIVIAALIRRRKRN